MSPRTWTGATCASPEAVQVEGGRSVVWTRPGPVPGRVNEDGAAVVPLPCGGAVLAVADGMGGHAGGAEAARLAVTELAAALREAPGADGDPRPAILDGIERAHAAIRALGIGAGATLAVAECVGARMRPYHIGDAGCLVIGQRGRLKLATSAHSPVGYAVEAGVLDPAAAMHHAERHVVSNALGADDMHIQVGTTRPLAPRDTVVLASDGLLDNLHVEEIVAAVRCGPLADAAAGLVALATARMAGGEAGAPSKPDDCTFILYRRRR